jgi:hypothetical protein
MNNFFKNLFFKKIYFLIFFIFGYITYSMNLVFFLISNFNIRYIKTGASWFFLFVFYKFILISWPESWIQQLIPVDFDYFFGRFLQLIFFYFTLKYWIG